MSASEFLRISFSRIELSAYSRSITVVFESPALTVTYRRRLSRQGRGRTLGCLFFKTFYNFKPLSLLHFTVSYEHNAEQNSEHTNTCGCDHNCNRCITSALNVNPAAVGFYSVLCKVAFYACSIAVQNLSKLLFRNVGILFPNLFSNGNYLLSVLSRTALKPAPTPTAAAMQKSAVKTSITVTNFDVLFIIPPACNQGPLRF